MESTRFDVTASLSQLSCAGFSDALAGAAPVPGGGGASALVGALAASLCAMAGNLTLGRKKYAAVEPDIRNMLLRLETLRARLLSLIDEDATGFAPLAQAYAIPKDDPSRAETMASALVLACEAPMDIMRRCCETITLLEEMREKGSAMLVSDVGVGAALARAALVGASMNVLINTKSMADAETRLAFEREADELLSTFAPRADAVVNAVQSFIRGEA